MRVFLKGNKGINLISLTIAVTVILILTGIIIVNSTSSLKSNKLRNMQADIDNLRDKVSNYYSRYGEIPADRSIEYTNTSHINSISNAVDTGAFYVIDLAAMENVTLNYGKDYEKIRKGEATTAEEVNKLTDLYIINADSHNIFYVQGIELDGETFYTDYGEEDKDTALVEIHGYKEYEDINGDIAIIPEGFEVSENEKEQIIEEGLVIKDKNESEFVWIPVDDINEMSQCANVSADSLCDLELQEDGTLKCETHNSTEIVGKLYSVNGVESFGTVNTTYNTNSGLREPAVVDSDNENNIFIEDLKSQYKEMATSVAKYKGFYVGRYELGLEGDIPVSKSAKINTNVVTANANNSKTVSWYGLYNKCLEYKNLETNNLSVLSTMIWGSQYDAMMNFMKKGNESIITITDNSSIQNNTLITGEKDTDVIKNVYDLYGCNREWTLEAFSNDGRTFRSNYNNSSTKRSLIYRNYYSPTDSYDVSSRIALYINDKSK